MLCFVDLEVEEIEELDEFYLELLVRFIIENENIEIDEEEMKNEKIGKDKMKKR